MNGNAQTPVPQNGQQGGQQSLLFALDIGTRSVIGVLGTEENGVFRVLDVAQREHARRTMIDGQIEDIAQVAAVAQMVREELEQRQNVSLRRVCVAAAGRALKTVRATGELALDAPRVLTPRDVYALEMNAVEAARETLVQETAQSKEDGAFHCVGHAVVRYLIDGYSFFTVKEHRASKVQVEIIATFLPSAVVQSLYGAMEMAGLQIESVTLEPIAAMNAVIPQELRLLNLALVDVGAGTSDIAISDSGSVAAYTMATVAGDEISEELIRACLVDFDTAERIKQTAGTQDCGPIAYENILGMPGALSREDALDKIRPAVESLAQTICEEIRHANGDKAPTAVFLVGGGAKTPFLSELVAAGLGLEPGKVALGGNNFFKRIAVSSKEIAGPEYATPLGIALTAVSDDSRASFFIQVNGEQVLAMHSKEMTALDVLLLCGYKYTDLLGRSGKSLEYRFNGKDYRVRGERFQPASLLINERPAAVSDKVDRGDALTVVPAVPGRDASLSIGQLLQYTEDDFFVQVQGERCSIARTLLRNGQPVTHADFVQQDDVLTYAPLTVGDVYSLWGVEQHRVACCVNGAAAQPDTVLQSGDDVTWHAAQPGAKAAQAEHTAPQDSAKAQEPQAAQAFDDSAPRPVERKRTAAQTPISENEQLPAPVPQAAEQTGVPEEVAPEAQQGRQAEPLPVVAPQELPQAVEELPQAVEELPQAVEASPQKPEESPQEPETSPQGGDIFEGQGMRVSVNGKTVTLPPRDTPYQFLDLLPMTDIDFNKPQGDVLLLHNGCEASYLDLIVNGDEVVVGWKPREAT